MSALEKKKPKRAWRPSLGSKVGKCDSHDANSNGIPTKKQVSGISALDCPSFDFCNCPVCPLDPDWHRHKHLPGEPVCRWLRESVKSGGQGTLSNFLTMDLVLRVVTVKDSIISCDGELKFRLERSSKSASKAKAMIRVRRFLS